MGAAPGPRDCGQRWRPGQERPTGDTPPPTAEASTPKGKLRLGEGDRGTGPTCQNWAEAELGSKRRSPGAGLRP